MTEIAIEHDQPVLRTEVRGNVLVITLNRPHAKHAFNGALASALSETLDRYDEDTATSVAVLTGSGGVIGVLLGLGISLLIHLFIPRLPSAVPLWSILVAVTVSMSVGLSHDEIGSRPGRKRLSHHHFAA